MSDPQRRSLWTFLLVGLVVLLGLATPFIFLVPIAWCPDCAEPQTGNTSHFGCIDNLLEVLEPCPRCRDTRKVTLVNKWSLRPDLSHRPKYH
jgi:hypothetical protein